MIPDRGISSSLIPNESEIMTSDPRVGLPLISIAGGYEFAAIGRGFQRCEGKEGG